jgi:hypothetical protein
VVSVAEWSRHLVVAQETAGSNPVAHPLCKSFRRKCRRAARAVAARDDPSSWAGTASGSCRFWFSVVLKPLGEILRSRSAKRFSDLSHEQMSL